VILIFVLTIKIHLLLDGILLSEWHLMKLFNILGYKR